MLREIRRIPAATPYIEQVESIVSTASQVLYKMSDIHDCMQIKKKSFKNNKEVFKPQTTFLQVLEINSLMAKQLSVKQKLNLPFNIPTFVIADKTRICQVSNNLIQNALQYAATNSLIEINVRVDNEDSLNVTVTNIGVQVREDQVPQLFKPK